MQRITQALLSGDCTKNYTQLLKDVRGLQATWMECSEGYLDQQESISEAKRLWNAAVTTSQNSILMEKQQKLLLTSVRELALFVLQRSILQPIDDSTLIQLYEMSIRVARGYNDIDDVGKVRLMLSKSADFLEELQNRMPISPMLEEQLWNTNCLFHVEKIKLELFHGASETMAEHLCKEALRDINSRYLPHFATDLVHSFTTVNNTLNVKVVLKVLELVFANAYKLESFPAHIVDDLIYAMVDLHIKQNTKVSIETASSLLEKVTLQNSQYFLAHLKILLLIGSDDQEICQSFVQAAIMSDSILGISEFIKSTKGFGTFEKCLKALLEKDPRSLPVTIRSDLVELRMMNSLSSVVQCRNILISGLGDLSEDARLHLQKFFVEKGEELFMTKQFSISLEWFQITISLMTDSSALDLKNKPVVQRKIVLCLLELKRVDEAEEAVLLMPFDLNGLTLRFYTALTLKNDSDAFQLLEKLKNIENITPDHLMGMANYCMSNGHYSQLLRILRMVIDSWRSHSMDFEIKLDVLQASISVADRVIPDQDLEQKLEIIGSIYSELIPSITLNTCHDYTYFFKFAWNMGAKANNSSKSSHASRFFFYAYQILCHGNWKKTQQLDQAKLFTIIGCLRSFFDLNEQDQIQLDRINFEKASLLTTGKGLLEDIEITNIYVPNGAKRARKEVDGYELDFQESLDSFKAMKQLQIVQFQLFVLDKKWNEASESIKEMKECKAIEELENLVIWVMERRSDIRTDIIFEVLNLYAEQVLASTTFKMSHFAFIYRGMSMVALKQSDQNLSLAYFQQALQIIKQHSEEYPKEEVCWLAVASYNHAIGLARLDADMARKWCELSLSLCHHSGEYREAHEQAIRAGYSQILKRLSI